MQTIPLELEPFVFTSLSSHFGTGWHIVVQGRRTLSGKDLDTFDGQVRQLTANAVAAENAQGYFPIGSWGVLYRLATMRDWQGRPGVYCSALAFPQDALLANEGPGAVAHVPHARWPYVSHEQAVELDRRMGGQFERAILLKAKEVQVPVRLLHPDDGAWMKEHLSVVMAVVESIDQGMMVLVDPAFDGKSLLRCVLTLLPRTARPKLTYLLHGDIPEKLPVSYVWPKSLQHDIPARCKVIDAASKPSDERFVRVAASLMTMMRAGTDIESFLKRLDRLSMEHEHISRWQLIIDFQPLLSIDDLDSLLASNPQEATEKLFSYWLLEPSQCMQLIGKRLVEWLTERTEWVAAVITTSSGFDRSFGTAVFEVVEQALAKLDPGVVETFAGALARASVDDTTYLLRLLNTQESALGHGFVNVLEAVLTAVSPDQAQGLVAPFARRRPDVLVHSRVFRMLARDFRETASREHADGWRTMLEACLRSQDPEVRDWIFRQPALLRAMQISDLDTHAGLLRGEYVAAFLKHRELGFDDVLKWIKKSQATDSGSMQHWNTYLKHAVSSASDRGILTAVEMQHATRQPSQSLSMALLREWARRGGDPNHEKIHPVITSVARKQHMTPAEVWASLQSNADARDRLPHDHTPAKHRKSRRDIMFAVVGVLLLVLALSVLLVIPARTLRRRGALRRYIRSEPLMAEYADNGERIETLLDVMRVDPPEAFSRLRDEGGNLAKLGLGGLLRDLYRDRSVQDANQVRRRIRWIARRVQPQSVLAERLRMADAYLDALDGHAELHVNDWLVVLHTVPQVEIGAERVRLVHNAQNWVEWPLSALQYTHQGWLDQTRAQERREVAERAVQSWVSAWQDLSVSDRLALQEHGTATWKDLIQRLQSGLPLEQTAELAREALAMLPAAVEDAVHRAEQVAHAQLRRRAEESRRQVENALSRIPAGQRSAYAEAQLDVWQRFQAANAAGGRLLERDPNGARMEYARALELLSQTQQAYAEWDRRQQAQTSTTSAQDVAPRQHDQPETVGTGDDSTLTPHERAERERLRGLANERKQRFDSLMHTYGDFIAVREPQNYRIIEENGVAAKRFYDGQQYESAYHRYGTALRSLEPRAAEAKRVMAEEQEARRQEYTQEANFHDRRIPSRRDVISHYRRIGGERWVQFLGIRDRRIQSAREADYARALELLEREGKLFDAIDSQVRRELLAELDDLRQRFEDLLSESGQSRAHDPRYSPPRDVSRALRRSNTGDTARNRFERDGNIAKDYRDAYAAYADAFDILHRFIREN